MREIELNAIGVRGREFGEALMSSSRSQQIAVPIRKLLDYRRRNGTVATVRATIKVAYARLGLPPLFRRTQRLRSRSAGDASPEVLFVIGCWEGESKRYRVFNIADELRSSGHSVEVIPYADIDLIEPWGLRPKVVVIFRAPDVPSTERYFSYARKQGIQTIFDVDDLVFEPGLVDRIDGYKKLNHSKQMEYRRGVERYRSLLRKCDMVTVSTAPLATAVTDLGKAVRVVPNTWNRIQGEIADRLLVMPRATRDGVVVGYFSGTSTHDRDFREAAPALLRLMRELPQLRLRIVGDVDLGAAFSEFTDRVERVPFLPYQDMLRALRECDINIAPLELPNPFNDAKSELKWFEAALVEVPSVVTPTEPFRSAVRHAETGFLAASNHEWYQSLRLLVEDPELRARVGRAARAAAIESFGPKAARVGAEAAYALSSGTQSVGVSGRKRIDWIVPGLILGGGGHRNILRAAYFLEAFGHDVELVFTNVEQSVDELRDLLHKHFYPFKGRIRRYDGIFRYSDALFATHWHTVDLALKARGMTREIMYFVQDFEPMFAPMGSEYILAENTYRKGLYCITSGPWCSRLLERDFGVSADYFEFPIDREVYYPRPRRKQNMNVLFFAKPDMPRRCYELGVMMLRELHAMMPDVEIVMYGSRGVETNKLGFPVTLRGVMPTIEDLAQSYADADLGVAFSTTNPSLVPYEMISCGTAVVDLGRPGNEVNYGDRFDVALLADPEPMQMARQVRDLLLNPAERAARVEAGLSFVSRMPTEEQMARRVEELILKRLER